MNGEVRVVGFHSPLHLVSCNRATEGVRRVAESDVEGNLVALDIAVEIADLVMTSGYFVRSGEFGSFLIEDVGGLYDIAVAGVFSFHGPGARDFGSERGHRAEDDQEGCAERNSDSVVLWRIPCEESLTIAMRGYCTEERG